MLENYRKLTRMGSLLYHCHGRVERSANCFYKVLEGKKKVLEPMLRKI